MSCLTGMRPDSHEILFVVVPEVGLEPTRRLDPRGILSPVRLPIPPLRHQRVRRSTFSIFCSAMQQVPGANTSQATSQLSWRGIPAIICTSRRRLHVMRQGFYHTWKLARCQAVLDPLCCLRILLAPPDLSFTMPPCNVMTSLPGTDSWTRDRSPHD
jgi:hypothetical protein